MPTPMTIPKTIPKAWLTLLLVLAFVTCRPLPLGAQGLDSLMRRHGLVDIRQLDTLIRVELRYSTTDNFVGVDMYGTLERAYLERGFAQRVVRAQRELTRRRPGYRLLIYDAARPMSVQRRMYDLVAGTPRAVYVAPATRGGRHNYGVAVDLTIVDPQGNPLDMGTPFDHFGEASHLGDEARWVRLGRMRPEAVQHRTLLREVMHTAGLRPYAREWWHYQETLSMQEVRRRYRRLDF